MLPLLLVYCINDLGVKRSQGHNVQKGDRVADVSYALYRVVTLF